MKITGTARPESDFRAGSLHEVAATSGVTMVVGNLNPGVDNTVRGHATVIQRVEFVGHTRDEADKWLKQNGIKATIKTRAARNVVEAGGVEGGTITPMKPTPKKKKSATKRKKSS